MEGLHGTSAGEGKGIMGDKNAVLAIAWSFVLAEIMGAMINHVIHWRKVLFFCNDC